MYISVTGSVEVKDANDSDIIHDIIFEALTAKGYEVVLLMTSPEEEANEAKK